MEDRYRNLRELPFDVVAGALGIDLTKFKLRGNGNWNGPCPVHRPKRNSTSFNYHGENGKIHCFSCDVKGRGAIDLAMAVRNIGFQEAVNLLTPYAGQVPAAPMQKPEIKVVQELPKENQPFKASYEKFFKPHPWLAERGLAPETLACYEVGYYQNDTRKSAYNGSVMLKIRRVSDGECVGYLSRNIGEITPEKPKYRFPEGLHKSLELFGAWQLKQDGKLPLRICYLVESPFSVMAFWQKGLPAVSPFGWSLSDVHIKTLGELARGVIALPDRDKAEAFGQYAHALSKLVWVRCPQMPEGVDDPEHLSLEQIRALT